MSKRGMSFGAAPEMAMMADGMDDMGMPEHSNALDSLFVYKMSSVNLQPKSRSSHVFQQKIKAILNRYLALILIIIFTKIKN